VVIQSGGQDPQWPDPVESSWCGEWQPAKQPVSQQSQEPKKPPQLRTPRYLANEIGLPPWGFKKIRMYARRAGVTPAAMADNIPLYDIAGKEAILAYIKERYPALIQPSPEPA